MNESGKLLFTLALFGIGIGGAWTFRRDGTTAVVAAPTTAESMVRRSSAAPREAEVEAVGARLTGILASRANSVEPAAHRPRFAGEYELATALMPIDGRDATMTETRSTREPVGAQRTAAAYSPDQIGSMRALHAAGSVPQTGDAGGMVEVNRPDWEESRQHVVRDGDTLGGLAERYYGDVRRYQELYDANAAQLANPDVLPIGATLVIPPPAGGPSSPTTDPPGARLLPRIEIRPPGQ